MVEIEQVDDIETTPIVEDFGGEVKDEMEVPPSQERLLDAEEIEKVAEAMTRPTAKMQLIGLAKKLRKEAEALKRVEASRSKLTRDKEMETETTEETAATTTTPTTQSADPTTAPVVATSTAVEQPADAPEIIKHSTVMYTPIDRFAFDDGGYNSPFVSLYIDLPNVGTNKDNVKCQFDEKSFDLIIHDLNGKHYRLFRDNLKHSIVVDKSKFIVKPNKVVIKLAKVKGEYGSYDHWSELVDKKKKKNSAVNNPSASIMEMMKEMYDDGDDQMRKMIGETMLKQRNGELNKDMGSSLPGMGGLDMDDDDF